MNNTLVIALVLFACGSLLAQSALPAVQPPHLTGIVRDPAGAPAPGVLVSFHPGRYPEAPLYNEANTDSDGRYDMAIRPDSRTVDWEGSINPISVVMARDLKRNLIAIQELGDTNRLNPRIEPIPTNLDLILQPGITISGSVKEPDGTPVSDAVIDFQVRSRQWLPGLEHKSAKVNAAGSFSFPALPQGCGYDIFNVTSVSHGSAFARVEATDTKTNHYEFPTFILKKSNLVLAGQVLDEDGKPAPQVPVRFYGEGQRRGFGGQSIKTDDNGRFVFGDVCEGNVTISVEYEYSWGSVAAQGGDTNVVFRVN